MSKLCCPLREATRVNPDKVALEDDFSYTYRMLDDYAEHIKEILAPYPKNSVFAIYPIHPAFTCALLFGALRLSHRVLILNPALPEKQLHEDYSYLNIAHIFSEPVRYIQRKRDLKKIKLDQEAPWTLLLTSGSSSKPKVCVHSLENHVYSALGSNRHLGYSDQDRWLLSLPLYHVSGLSILFRTLLANATCTLPHGSLEEDLKRVSFVSFVPTQLKRLINSESLLHLKCILLGGAPIPDELLTEAWERGLAVRPTYGLTEMASQVATYSPYFQKLEVLPYRELKITAKNEVLVRGKTLFLGYQTKEGLEKPFDEEGWFSTRDLGTYESDHFTYIGRLDNQFISGGENIQPEEIEAYLLNHPDVDEAVVVPIEDPDYGHRPLAWIRSKRNLSEISFERFLKEYLPKFKWPVQYKKLESIGFKPKRAKLKEQAHDTHPSDT